MKYGRHLHAMLVAALLVAVPSAAIAEVPDSTQNSVQVGGPVSSGPAVTQGSASYGSSGIEASASSREAHGSSPGPGPGGGSGYTYQPLPFNSVVVGRQPQLDTSGVIHVAPAGSQAACQPGQTGFSVFDPNGNPAGITCVGSPQPQSAPAPAPLDLARQASDHQPWPQLVIGINPDRGLAGLPAWFWLGGGSPHVPTAAASAGDLTVTVQAALVGVNWDFGDGSHFDSGSDLGQPYPAQSDVQHIYQTDTYGRPDGYQVSATLTFSVQYAVNGGAPVGLGTKSRVYSRSYSVNQLQPQAVSQR